MPCDTHSQLHRLWFWWLFASLLGSLCGGLAILRLTSNGPRWQTLAELALIWLAGGGIAGLASGGFQAALLQRYMPRAWWWMPLTTCGSSVAWLLAHLTVRGLLTFMPGIARTTPGYLWNTILFLAIGLGMPVIAILITGAFQSLWFRKQTLQSSLWLRRMLISALLSWPLAVAACYLTAQAPVWPFLQTIHGSLGWWMGLYFSAGLIPGIIGGSTIIRIIRLQAPQPHSPALAPTQHTHQIVVPS